MGKLVPIEMCNYLAFYPEMINVTVRNPAFDVTPHQYIDIICTEAGPYLQR